MLKQTLLVILLATQLCFGTITRTARGTTSATTTGTTLTLSVTASTNERLIVFALCNGNTQSVSTIAWTGATFSAADSSFNNGSTNPRNTEIWSANVTSGGTNTMTVTWTGNCSSRHFMVSSLASDIGAISVNSSLSFAGAAASDPHTNGPVACTPNSGATCAWMALVANASTTNSAVYTVPANTGQTNENVAHGISEGYEIDSTFVSQTLAATISAQPAWACVFVTYTEPAAPGGTPHGLMLHGMGLGILWSHWKVK